MLVYVFVDFVVKNYVLIAGKVTGTGPIMNIRSLRANKLCCEVNPRVYCIKCKKKLCTEHSLLKVPKISLFCYHNWFLYDDNCNIADCACKQFE